MSLPKERVLKVYEDMLLIRRFEEEVERFSKNGTIPGFVHLSIGQEATQAGIIDALRETDYKYPDHRSHGAIVLSSHPEDRKTILAEIFGKKTGINGGRGGSMHVNDLKVRNMGNNAIEGSIVVTCLGSAFASVYNHTDDVTAVFMGDGTLGEGACHESLNMSATWKLPIIYCLVNNQYAISTQYRESHPQPQLATWADGYCVPNETIDGNDIEAVIPAVERAAARARAGQGPTLIEFMTYRWQGHFSGDPAAYRPQGELEKWKEKDPIKVTKTELMIEHGVSEEQLDAIRQRVETEIASFVKFALESPDPDPEDAVKHVYADIEVEGR
ncbi:MAG TPA: thiamine pyrophosphate-dependent dehydrogenase E1 component subunit alpha [Anaerolineaceae bacterium]|nr:thiamine pyrophosphate-dependent dehydrogenase E1 component subunit alpha [Anaerolineaceae bacterium]